METPKFNISPVNGVNNANRLASARKTLKLAIPKLNSVEDNEIKNESTASLLSEKIANSMDKMNGKIIKSARNSSELNSADIKNNNDIFGYGLRKDSSPKTKLSNNTIFSEIPELSLTPSAEILNSNTSTNPVFSRLFSLSPSVLRNYNNDNMSEFPESTQHVSPATASMLENFHKKNNSSMASSSSNSSSLLSSNSTRQNLINSSSSSSSSSSSVKETSSTSQQVVNSSSTTTRVEKKSQRLHHVTTSEMKAHALKRDLNDFKNSMSEINDLAMSRTQKQNSPLLGSSALAMDQLKQKLKSSLENLVDDSEPMVTFPDGENENDELQIAMSPTSLNPAELTNGHLTKTANGITTSTMVDTVKFEEKRIKSESKTKVITDGFSSEQATSNSAEMKRLQAGDLDYKEQKSAAAMRNKLEVDGVKTEQNAALIKEARSIRTNDVTQQSSNNIAAASVKVQSDSFSAEKKAISQAQQRQTVTSSGMFNQEKKVSSASQSYYSSGSSMISSSQYKSMNGNSSGIVEEITFDDLEGLCPSSNYKDVEKAISKYSSHLQSYINNLRNSESMNKAPSFLNNINEIIQRAWAVPTYGHELGYSLCNSLRASGGLDLLMKNCVEGDTEVKFSSARLLEQCLTTENRSHVVENGLEKVVNVACVCTKNSKTDHSRVGTGILEHLFKHSEGTCSDVIRLGGLDAVLFECRKNDIETLRHCAGALANLSLYGGAENQIAMIKRKVPMWLFPLAFHDDDIIKYYACLAIAVLVANKEIEAEVLKSGTLDLVEPFVTKHIPSEFAKSNLAYAHGQSKHWLQRLVPVLSSNREEARNLAAFHFCMEAGIKKEQGNTEIFKEIGAIEPLKNVASCPNAIASKFAAQALRLIGEQVPHKLSQQVPLWSVEDVQEWVKQIGFGEFENNFYESRVDGDLLLQLTEDNLRDDIGITNGIRRKRFARELQSLKKLADYSSKDAAKLNNVLSSIGLEYCIYTYSMLNAGVDRDSLPHLSEDQLIAECGINNSIHRLRILNTLKNIESSLQSVSEESMAKTLDIFISYRRSNGSQLASLLKVHLQLRGFSVFIDVERLEAGKFDNNLLNSIKQAKHFILVLTPEALERCIEDFECKDWVHREIVAALNSSCNIIPIIDNFEWPEPEHLPEDMRSVCHFNGVRWIHDYQDACVDKLERFMRGEINARDRNLMRGDVTPSTPGTASTTRNHPPSYQRMHSNDSGKLSDKEGSTNGQNSSGNGNGGGSSGSNQPSSRSVNPNKYRKSSSPGRQWMASSPSLSGGGIGNRGYSRVPIGGPYRNPHLHSKIPGSPTTAVGARTGRRSSAGGVLHQRPPLPPTISGRSHSLDGLLDTCPEDPCQDEDKTEDAIDSVEEDANENEVLKRDKTSAINNTQNRKSRSLEHLLEDNKLEETSPIEVTQSMENLKESSPVLSDIDSTSKPPIVKTPESPPTNVKTAGKISSSRQSPEGTSSIDEENEETRSNYSTASTTTSSGKPNKTFINRAVKKVRSLIKKDENINEASDPTVHSMQRMMLTQVNSPNSSKMVFF